MNMICNHCGKNLNDDARFCDSCKAQIDLVNNQKFYQSDASINTGLAFHGTTNNKSNRNMKKVIIIVAIIIIAMFFLVKVFGNKSSNNNSNINNSNNNGQSVATIDFSDAMDNPEKYQKYENKIITIKHVYVWNTNEDIILGKVIFSLNCTNKDSFNLEDLEDGDYVTIKGQLSRIFSTGFTMNGCTLTKE